MIDVLTALRGRTEDDVMLGVTELVEAVEGFRVYYRCAVDPTFECPF